MPKGKRTGCGGRRQLGTRVTSVSQGTDTDKRKCDFHCTGEGGHSARKDNSPVFEYVTWLDTYVSNTLLSIMKSDEENYIRCVNATTYVRPLIDLLTFGIYSCKRRPNNQDIIAVNSTHLEIHENGDQIKQTGHGRKINTFRVSCSKPQNLLPSCSHLGTSWLASFNSSIRSRRILSSARKSQKLVALPVCPILPVLPILQ